MSYSCFLLHVTINTLHLDEFNFRFDSWFQVLKLVKSCWRTSQSFAPKIVRCSLVSSAYKAMLVCSWMASGRSLINITKRSGPTRLPWGTQVTGRRTQASPSITTLCDLSFSYSENQSNNWAAASLPFQLFNKSGMVNRDESLGKFNVQNICLFLSSDFPIEKLRRATGTHESVL